MGRFIDVNNIPGDFMKTIYQSAKLRSAVGLGIMHGVIIFFCSLVLLPLCWVLLLSIKTVEDAAKGTLWPSQFDYTHYRYVADNLPYILYNFSNSIIVSLATIVLTTTVSVLAGYALVHVRLPGRGLVLAILLGTLFFPTRIVSLLGIYQLQMSLGLINTLVGLILPYVTLNLAVSIFIMRGAFLQISRELVEAAKIDGASSWRILVEILLPLVTNACVVVVIVNFVTSWGEYLLAATLAVDQNMRTLPVVLVTTFGAFGEWAPPRSAAVYVMAIIPGIALFGILQRWYMQGLMDGAIKQ